MIIYAHIRVSGIEKLNERLKNNQNKSSTDGFMLSIWMIYVICITYFSNSQPGSVVCVRADE
ncbi:hypothetical protein TUM20903_17030 [Citrobacter koseri]|nr:hypothetical protein TUM13189_17250 [Citrobacter koseri]BDG88965.1 hypothetical protein TUM20903_17030 [Citrobacter koseri]